MKGTCSLLTATLDALRLLLATCLLVLVALPGYAEEEAAKPKNVDPFEVINRPIYMFNGLTDRFLLRPAGQVYNFAIPAVARKGVGNFFDNITYPVTIINGLLQGKFKQAGSDTLRFIVNSTFGILGIMDLATGQGLTRHDEDLGQTFAKWGIPAGPYIVIPIIGPSTVRDGIGIMGDVRVNPLVQMNNSSVRDKLLILWTIEARAALIGPDAAVYDAFDPYLFIRDAYLQNREFLINDNSAPIDQHFEEEFEDGFDDDF